MWLSCFKTGFFAFFFCVKFTVVACLSSNLSLMLVCCLNATWACPMLLAWFNNHALFPWFSNFAVVLAVLSCCLFCLQLLHECKVSCVVQLCCTVISCVAWLQNECFFCSSTSRMPCLKAELIFALFHSCCLAQGNWLMCLMWLLCLDNQAHSPLWFLLNSCCWLMWLWVRLFLWAAQC